MESFSRRNFLKTGTAASMGSVFAMNSLLSCSANEAQSKSGTIHIDPTPLHKISPTFFMQFLEPLGVTDPAIEAAWDYGKDNWREDLIKCVADLQPGMIRWGGNFTRYYKWREGIGPTNRRPPMYNYYWGGKETNRVGTHEFVDLCKRTGAEPLLGVNFMSDGFEYFKDASHGQNRFGTLEEAADWVSYCNDPDHRERKKNGAIDPFGVKYWQVGNETSYGGENGFSLEQAIEHTRKFSEEMRRRDPSIKLIGWGDVPNVSRFSGVKDEEESEFWASGMLKANGDILDMIAIHIMGIYPKKTEVLKGFEFFKNPEQAWNEFLDLANIAEFRLSKLKKDLQGIDSDTKFALTEGHLSLSPHNTNTILQTWLSAAYHAQTMNTYLRHSDRVSICTGADFFGSRWTVNAVKMPVPGGESYLLPIGVIMRLYAKYGGDTGIKVVDAPTDLDIAATRKDDKVYLHILNKNFNSAVKADLNIENSKVTVAKTYEIAPEDKLAYVDDNNRNTFDPVERQLADLSALTIPAASVSVIELQIV